MKISVIIPCFNEINTIEKILHRIRSVDNINFEIIVVDDFSTDGTRELLQSKLSGTISSLVLHDKNFGKGASFRTGLRHATGDIVLIQDADLEYSPEEYPKLLQPILDGHADVVYGSRFRSGEATRVLYYWHSLGNKFLTGLSNIFTDFNLTDMETCYKVFRNEVIKQIKIEETRFGFEPEITAKISKLRPRVRMFEVGISYNGRTYEEGKKIGWKDGIRAIYAILKYNLLR